MRPITIIPTSPAVASTAAAGPQRPASSPSNPETNGRPFTNGTSNPSNPEPKLLTASPLSPSSSTASFVSKKVLSKSESKTEVNVTKKPPPAAPKRSSLLSDSISKFEQNGDGAKPKVSWKSFIKPSPSKDKLAVNGTSSNNSNSVIVPAAKETTETTVDTVVASHEKKVKPLDENNNEVKSDEQLTKPDEPAAISNAKPILKPKPITNGSASVIIESKTDPEPTAAAVVAENGTTSQPAEDPTSLATSPPPPVKVKRIVKKIIRRTVTKSSSDLSTLGEQQEGEKVVKIIKKKVIKAKPAVEVEIGEDALAVANQSSQASTDTAKPTKPTLPEPTSAPITIEHKPPSPPEIITTVTTTTSDQPISESPSLQLNGKSPARPAIRPMLPAHRSHTIDLGLAQETILKLPPTPPTIILPSQPPLPKTTSPSMDRRRSSWGKLDKMPLSLALSRDSTLDDFSRESSLVSSPPPPRSTSPYSLSSTRSSSVLSNYESWQSSRSVTPRRSGLSHSYHGDSEDLSPLDHAHYTQRLRLASPALSERSAAASDYLSEKIEHFLKRTDHASQEWKRVGRSATNSDLFGELYGGTSRSKSVSSIMSRGLQLLRDSSRSSSRMSSVSRDSFQDCLDDDNRTVVDDNELSEMTAEFAEEHSSSNLISERLEAETTERLRLEKEVKEHEAKYRNLQESSEKLEMELLCAKSDLNGDLDDDLEGDEAGANAYRLKYERVARELEFTKKRLQTQHEHDLEQLIALKKQLEKKLADAYEEVEEQRQVVGQWKRKAQKMTNEMNDLRMLLEEQNSRNNLLEKRQRKFDSECQALQDSARQEKQAKERLAREKDVLIAEKFTIEQTLSDVRLELELKEEKYSALQRELEEMTFGGGTEEEIAQLKRQKLELDRRCKEQEEELDEMAGQIQLLEQAKLRLEMSLETMRKDARKEAQQRDDELEEVRGSSYKKIKSLECQLEQEHEERTLLLREKHELERRLNNLEDQDRVERAAEEAASQKLKRDLRKYKALLRDAQSQLERAKSDSAGKALIRQLRNQLEDAESARSAAVKVRQVAESELQDVQLMLEEAQRARFDSEERATAAQRDRAELQAQIDENEEEMAELMKKYSATVKQLSSEQAMITDYELKISELESEKKSLKEQISDLTSRLESVENIGDSSTSIQFKRLELRTKELESRLEFEQATRARMEIQLNRHKDSLEKAQSEISQTRTKEMHAQEALKKAQKTIRELREELHLVANKEQESLTKRKDLEKRLESVEAEAASARADLRLALQRIADLQQAMEEGDSYHSDSENSDSSIDSVSEVNYHSPTKISSLRARSGGENGTTGTNGSSTTLCIREEKENTPRIRYKYKPRGLRRRRLPCTIAEEDEAEDGVVPECSEEDQQLDSVIESIKSAINDEDGGDDETKTAPVPKYTGAIKKTTVGKNPVSLKDELEQSDANNNVIPKGQSKSLESTIVEEIAKASTVVADHLNDDSRFDLNALKSIKEKIKSLNNSLKEEAAQERCSKYEFPPPPTPVAPSTSLLSLESGDSVKASSSFHKLDQIGAELNVEGIRSMKEKIRNLKKRLQDESGSSEGPPINKAQIASEIVEMKKTLTAAFMNKSSEKVSSLSRSSSQKEEKPTAFLKVPSSSETSVASTSKESSPSRSPIRTNSKLLQDESSEIIEKVSLNRSPSQREEKLTTHLQMPTSSASSKEPSPAPSRSPARNYSTPIESNRSSVVLNGGSLPQTTIAEERRFVSSLDKGDVTSVAECNSAENNKESPPAPLPPPCAASLLLCSNLETRVDVNDGSPEEEVVVAAVNNPPTPPPYVASSCCEPAAVENVSNQETPLHFDSQCETDSLRTTSGSCEVTEEKQEMPVERVAEDVNIAPETDGKDILEAETDNTTEPPSFALKITLNSVNTTKSTNKLVDISNESLEPKTDAIINQEQPTEAEEVKLSQVTNNEERETVNSCSNVACRTSPLCKCENIDQTIELLVKSMEIHRDLTQVAEIEGIKDLEEVAAQPKREEPAAETIIAKETISVEEVACSEPTAENIELLSVETVTPVISNQTVEKLEMQEDSLELDSQESSALVDQLVDQGIEQTPSEEAKEQTQEVTKKEMDENNNQEKSAKKDLPAVNKETKGSLKPSKSRNNCHHGSLKRNAKPEASKASGSKSNPSSRRSSVSSEHAAKVNTIYTDLAKGTSVASAEPTEKKVVDVSPTPSVVPTEDITKNQVSERALVVVDQSQDCGTNESSSCPSTTVSTDVVMPSKGGGGSSPSPRPLSYAESLKKARSPPKVNAPAVEPWVAIKQEYANKAAAAKQRKQQQPQQTRVRHPSLARNGSSGSIPRDGSVIRQSKSATKIFAKDLSLPSSSAAKKPLPDSTKQPPPTTQNRSKSGQRNAQQLVAKETNKSNPNLIQDKKLREAKGQPATNANNHQQHRQSRQPTGASNGKKK